MKKKYVILTVFLLTVSVIMAFCVRPVMALFVAAYPQKANYHTAMTSTSFSVTEQGIARVYVDYLGYESAVNGIVQITIRRGESVVLEESHAIDGDQHFHVYEYPLYETGAYRCTVVYTVNGNDGTQDVITFRDTAECTVSATRVPEVNLPTEEMLLDENGRLCEKLLIERNAKGERIRDTVYDANGNLLAELRYHDQSADGALSSYYSLGSLNRLKAIEIPRATATFTVWDASGKKLLFGTHEYRNQCESLTVSDGNDEFLLAERREYDDDGRVIHITEYDEKGVAIETKAYEYREDGHSCVVSDRETSIREIYDRNNVLQERETYDADARILSSVEYEYDVRNASVIPSAYTEYHYDANGVLETEQAFDGAHILQKQTDYENGSVYLETVYTANGDVLQETFYSYDENGKLQRKMRYQRGTLCAAWFPLKNSELLYVEYDERGVACFAQYRDRNNVLTEQIRFQPSTSTYEYSTFLYDAQGRMTEERIEVTKGYGASFLQDLTANYVMEGAPSYITVYPNAPKPTVSTRTRTYEYGAHGISTMLIYYGSELRLEMRFLYRANGTKIKETLSEYQNGNVVSETETEYAANGTTVTRKSVYNQEGRMVRQTRYRADGQAEKILYYENERLTHTMQYVYGDDGTLLSSTLSDRAGAVVSSTEYEYKNGRLTRETMRFRRTVVSVGADGKSKAESRDAVYRMEYLYDRKGTLTEKTESINSQTVRYTYYQYNSLGIVNRTIVETPNGRLTTDHDPYGVVISEIMTVFSDHDPMYLLGLIPVNATFRCDYRP